MPQVYLCSYRLKLQPYAKHHGLPLTSLWTKTAAAVRQNPKGRLSVHQCLSAASQHWRPTIVAAMEVLAAHQQQQVAAAIQKNQRQQQRQQQQPMAVVMQRQQIAAAVIQKQRRQQEAMAAVIQQQRQRVAAVKNQQRQQQHQECVGTPAPTAGRLSSCCPESSSSTATVYLPTDPTAIAAAYQPVAVVSSHMLGPVKISPRPAPTRGLRADKNSCSNAAYCCGPMAVVGAENGTTVLVSGRHACSAFPSVTGIWTERGVPG